MRGQLKAFSARLAEREEGKELRELADALSDSLTSIEKALYQTQNRSGQDPLNYPIRLNNKLASLAGTASTGDFAPTQQMQKVYETLMEQIRAELDKLDALYAKELAEFNEMVREAEVPAVLVPSDAN